MFPIYMYVKEYKGLKDFEITFDNNYEIKYNREKDTLSINKKFESTNNDIENFYSIYKTKGNIDSVNLLIGKNGSGKTNILEILNLSLSDAEILGINYMILYKFDVNSEDFILEKSFFSDFIKIKESKEINFKEDLYKHLDDKNYIENTGVVKFSFKEKVMNASMRQSKFQEKNDFRNIYKANIGNGSKKYIYDYLMKINQEGNNDNFENTYLTLIIPDLYVKLIDSDEGKILHNLYCNEINDKFFRLYVDNDSFETFILNNCFNYIYLTMILVILDSSNKKIFSKEKLRKMKNKLLKLLNGKSPNEKFEILLKKFERILKKINKSVVFKFNRENYNTIEKIAAIINNMIKEGNMTDIGNGKFKISFRDSEEIIDLLQKYDNFQVPGVETNEDLLFKDMEYIQIEEEGLSDGERIKLQYFSTLYGVLNGEFKDREFITLLFDEAETYLHPEWCRRFLYELIEELGRYKGKKFKLIFATHSPFLIADVLAKDCIYLSKNKKGKIKAEIKEDVKTFGANIIDLFKNTMFLESTFGKFATEKIKGVVDKIEKAEKYSDIKHEVDFIIDEIGEKLISNKLKSMIKSKFENKDEEKDEEYYRKKIEEYQAKLGELEKKENNRNSKK